MSGRTTGLSLREGEQSCVEIWRNKFMIAARGRKHRWQHEHREEATHYSYEFFVSRRLEILEFVFHILTAK